MTICIKRTIERKQKELGYNLWNDTTKVATEANGEDMLKAQYSRQETEISTDLHQKLFSFKESGFLSKTVVVYCSEFIV